MNTVQLHSFHLKTHFFEVTIVLRNEALTPELLSPYFTYLCAYTLPSLSVGPEAQKSEYTVTKFSRREWIGSSTSNLKSDTSYVEMKKKILWKKYFFKNEMEKQPIWPMGSSTYYIIFLRLDYVDTYFIGSIFNWRACIGIPIPEIVLIKPISVASRSILYIVSNDQVFFWIEVSHSWSQTNGILKTLLTHECSSIFRIYYLIKINFVSCMDFM